MYDEIKNNTSKMNCVICLQNTKNMYIQLGCSHCFHKCCLDKWLNINNTCPLCRIVINNGENDGNDIENILKNWFTIFTVDEIETIVKCFDEYYRYKLIDILLLIAIKEDDSEYMKELMTRLFFLY